MAPVSNHANGLQFGQNIVLGFQRRFEKNVLQFKENIVLGFQRRFKQLGDGMAHDIKCLSTNCWIKFYNVFSNNSERFKTIKIAIRFQKL